MAPLIHVGKAEFEIIPGEDGPIYFHISVFAFYGSVFLTEIQKDKTGLPWHQRAQRQKLL